MEEYYHYEEYDEDYYKNVDFEEIDPCNLDRTVYDLNVGLSCTHDAFNDKTRTVPINERGEYSNIPGLKECCPNHGYLYPDGCEVMLFRSKFILFYISYNQLKHLLLYVFRSSV